MPVQIALYLPIDGREAPSIWRGASCILKGLVWESSLAQVLEWAPSLLVLERGARTQGTWHIQTGQQKSLSSWPSFPKETRSQKRGWLLSKSFLYLMCILGFEYAVEKHFLIPSPSFPCMRNKDAETRNGNPAGQTFLNPVKANSASQIQRVCTNSHWTPSLPPSPHCGGLYDPIRNAIWKRYG